MADGGSGRQTPKRAPRRPAGLPVAEGFVLDLVAHELMSERGAVHLRPREFQLLAALAANPGRALSRDELVSLAWGREGRVGVRSVDVHIHWLRSKIEPVPAEPTHLIAIRGFGYRLDPVPVGEAPR
jgi:DNA-binding response OmpR family regulator